MPSRTRPPSWSATCRRRGGSSMTEPPTGVGACSDGCGVGTRIAQLMYNCPEYLESSYAAFKLRATPVNVNYRYKSPEIAYICDNAGAEVLCSTARSAAGRRAPLRRCRPCECCSRSTTVRRSWKGPSGTTRSSMPRACCWIERSGEDTLMLYTGGTTGNPKGVVWRHVDLFAALASRPTCRRASRCRRPPPMSDGSLLNSVPRPRAP